MAFRVRHSPSPPAGGHHGALSPPAAVGTGNSTVGKSGCQAAAQLKPALEGMKGLRELGHLPFHVFVLKPI